MTEAKCLSRGCSEGLLSASPVNSPIVACDTMTTQIRDSVSMAVSNRPEIMCEMLTDCTLAKHFHRQCKLLKARPRESAQFPIGTWQNEIAVVRPSPFYSFIVECNF